MIVSRSYQPYKPYHRQRRSFRKLYYALLIALTFLLWQTGNLPLTRRSHPDPKADGQQLEARTAPEIIDRRLIADSSKEKSVYVDHVRPKPSPQTVEDIGEVYSSPAPKAQALTDEEDPIFKKDTADLPKLSTLDESDQHDIDSIDAIHETTGDTVEHAAKLKHPDDDDAHMSDSEHPQFNSDEQVRVNTPKGQDHMDIDELLKADHPSKEFSTQGSEEDTDGEHPDDSHRDSLRPPIEVPKEMTPWTENYKFPAWDECQSIKEKADALPDMLIVPFEQSVKDVVLDGWEDDWIAKARYTGPKLAEPKIDFVYNWVNGSQKELVNTMRPYELNSTLNDEEGTWIASHGSNRYREWGELRYSMRSVEKYAKQFTNRIQILVNAFQNPSQDGESYTVGKQRPEWLKEGLEKVQVLSQEEFFGPDERKCLPSFDSLTIENQLYNTKSETDRLFALSDDMILGKPHSASDLYSPLFGPTLGFKDNAYNTLQPPTEKDAERFGEKPFLIYTSWLLNRRFGARKRKGQVHFGHSLSRSIAREAITSFPRPALRSAYQRFRGETGFQLYSWYVMFHYTMERHREALLWSYIMLRSDANDDGYLSWSERKKILRELAEGMANDSPEQYRRRIYYRVADHLEEAGLEPPKVNTEILWTSLDGPAMIKDLDCDAFDTEDCLAPGFSMPSSDAEARSPVFSSAAIFDRVARESPRCGDCLLKLILNRRRAGLGPVLPHATKKAEQRSVVVKALMKYQYTVVVPDAKFYMVTDAEQAEHILLKPYIKHNNKVGQMCLNDDVVTTDEGELNQLGKVMSALFEGLLPEPSSFEK